MTDHLSSVVLNALADGELSADQLTLANEHLSACPACTSSALYQNLLKTATAKAGQRYTLPPHLEERLRYLAAEADLPLHAPRFPARHRSHSARRFGWIGWAVAAGLLLVSVSVMMVQRIAQRAEIAAAHAALVTEVFDQHIATLAGSAPLQVLSTDRHTVKPWFQGKLPFSFNLPEILPGDTTLDGANLTYLNSHPVAQLLYSIGRHRVSIFVREQHGAMSTAETEHSGFHVIVAGTSDLEMVAVSDVDRVRLSELLSAIRLAQATDSKRLQ